MVLGAVGLLGGGLRAFGRVPRRFQLLLQAFPFSRMLDGPNQHARRGLALCQIILGALANRLHAGRVVFPTGQNQDGQTRGGSGGPF